MGFVFGDSTVPRGTHTGKGDQAKAVGWGEETHPRAVLKIRAPGNHSPLSPPHRGVSEERRVLMCDRNRRSARPSEQGF